MNKTSVKTPHIYYVGLSPTIYCATRYHEDKKNPGVFVAETQFDVTQLAVKAVLDYLKDLSDPRVTVDGDGHLSPRIPN